MHRKPIFSWLALVTFFLAGCQESPLPTEPFTPASTDPVPRSTIDRFALEQLEQFQEFTWSMADVHLLWSASVRSDSMVAIGYRPAGAGDLKEDIHLIDIQEPAWKAARQKITDFIVEETRRAYPDADYQPEDLFPFPKSEVLPAIDAKIFNEQILSRLREMPEVRYVEPLGYEMEEPAQRSDSGCDVSASNNISTADYTGVAPDVKVPWNFYNMKIPQAWNTSTGAGIKIALIDTGTSPDQQKLGSDFNSGYSTNRSISRTGTYSPYWFSSRTDGPDDRCGHGTQMAGLLAAPRGSGGASVGAAYNASLLAIRATSDVVVNGSAEKTGVANALVLAANQSDVRIISMSIGDVFSSGRVADGVRYAYNKGKLIFAAAGTSLSWTSWWGVIFPANMNETVAVTGVKDGSSLQRCNTCHDGSKVDFVAVMQRSSDNSRTSLTLAPSGNSPARVGGSSAATATMAGIAALVWSTNKGMTRDQVVQRLKNASQFYPYRDGNFGYGLVDAEAAVNGWVQ